MQFCRDDAHCWIFRGTWYLNLGLFGASCLVQVLLWLFGVWSINFKSALLYSRCPSISRATHCQACARAQGCQPECYNAADIHACSSFLLH